MFDPSRFSAAQWGLVPLLIFARYLFVAGFAYLFFYVWKRRRYWYRKIQQRFPYPADYLRELGYSTFSSLVFGATAWLCLGTPLRRYTRFYSDVDDYGVGWLLCSIVLAILIHDCYFYWAHRLMHHPRLYRRMHLTHHLSVNPSPWAAFAFSPLEALAEAAIIPILLFSIPLHPIAFFSFVMFMMVFNVYGHLGYELFPRSTYRHPLGRWLNSTVYHNLHHEKFTGNYGLYFLFWDRLCGTLRSDSEQRLDELHRQIEAEKSKRAAENNKTSVHQQTKTYA